MKRILAAVGVVLTLGSISVVQAANKSAQSARDADAAGVQSSREPTAERQGAEQIQQMQKLQKQIEDAKAAHQSLIDELNAIRTTATKERAKLTVKQVEALVSQQQTTFQESLRQMEQQFQQLQTATRSRALRPGPVAPRVRQAPDFEMTTFDGRKERLADYKGQIVVLEWLNPECPYSKFHYETAKTMLDTAKKYRGKGVVWMAVNSTFKTTPEINRDFSLKYKLPYPILDDRSGDLARKYGARTTPQIFILDKEGHIAYEGAIDNARIENRQPSAGKLNYVDQALAELTANRKISTPNTVPYGTPIHYGRP